MCYDSIIQAAKGSIKEKKLAPGFITKFFRYFPSLHDAAIDAILDLIEDEDSQVSGEKFMLLVIILSILSLTCSD